MSDKKDRLMDKKVYIYIALSIFMFLLVLSYKDNILKYVVHVLDISLGVYASGKDNSSTEKPPQGMDYGTQEYFEWWVTEFNRLHHIDKFRRFNIWKSKHSKNFVDIITLLKFPSKSKYINSSRGDELIKWSAAIIIAGYLLSLI